MSRFHLLYPHIFLTFLYQSKEDRKILSFNLNAQITCKYKTDPRPQIKNLIPKMRAKYFLHFVSLNNKYLKTTLKVKGLIQK